MDNYIGFDAESISIFDLSPNETIIYKILLHHQIMTAKMLAKTANLPVQTLYRLLESLTNKKLVSYIGHHPTYYKPTPPSLALNCLIEKKVEDLSLKKEKILEFISQYISTPSQTYICSLSRDKLLQRYQTLASEATKIALICPDEQFLIEANEFHAQSLTENRQLRMISHCLHDLNTPTFMQYKRKNLSIGYFQDLGMFLSIFDNQKAILGPCNQESSLLEIHGELFTSSLKQYFDLIWGKCELL